MDAVKKKKILITVVIIIAVIGIIIFIAEIISGNGVNGKYIGTKSGTNVLGSASTWETVIILESGGKYTLTVTRLQSNKVTFSSNGTYQTTGENSSIIIFTDTNGTTFQGKFLVTIRGQDYISLINSGISDSCGYATACYKS